MYTQVRDAHRACSDVYDPQQAHVNGRNESKGVMQNPRALSITTHISSY